MYRVKCIKLHKALALLLSLFLILTGVFGSTFAQIITKTPSFINTFLSGLDLTGDLVIRKEVTHPFGQGYIVPNELSFDFTVSLGVGYAGKSVETSQGDMIADENGNIIVSAGPDGAVRIKNLRDGTAVTVTESSSGAFTPEGGAERAITIQTGENTIVYTNNYAPGPVNPVNMTVSGTKILDGRDWQEGDFFTFQLEYKLAGSDTWQNAGTTSISYNPSNDDFNKFSFTELVNNISYAYAGVYSFRISEIEGIVGGITYDKVVSYFDVTVGDVDMNGSLEIQDVEGFQNAVASYDTSTGKYHVDVTVNNKYTPAGTATATIVIDKHVMSMSGEEKSAAGYTFNLYDESGNLVATSGETSAAGETSIELIFDAMDAGTTFHYTLKETHGGETHNGIIYADTVYPISVSIVDNLDGTVSAYVYNSADYQTELIEVEPEEPEQTEPVQTEPETEPVQTEPVQTEPETEPVQTEPVQTQETEAVVTTPETTSELVAEIVTEPVHMSSGLNTIDISEETQARSIASAPPENINISTEGDEDLVGKLSIAPISDNESDTSVVTSNQLEKKEVVVIPEGAGSSYTVFFENVYDPTDTDAFFGGTKELTGRSINEGEFTFTLYETGDSFTVAEDMEPKQTVSNDVEGNFSFASISYSKVGTYRYVVKEDTSAKLGGITYDDSVYLVIVTVTDENGILKANVAITDELGTAAEMKFENSYQAAATSISLTGTKNLIGMDLTAGMFQFHLYKADSNYVSQSAPLSGAFNDASGQFCFENISCPEPGTFYYVVKEDTSSPMAGMTYDDTVYGIEVVVRDDGTGLLKEDIKISEIGSGQVDEIVFENSYSKVTEPDEPDKPEVPEDTDAPADPKKESADKTLNSEASKDSSKADTSDGADTGDSSPVGMYIALITVSFVVVMLIIIVNRKKHKENSELKQ